MFTRDLCWRWPLFVCCRPVEFVVAFLHCCWFVGLLVCWFVGLLVCWFVGLLFCCLLLISPFPVGLLFYADN